MLFSRYTTTHKRFTDSHDPFPRRRTPVKHPSSSSFPFILLLSLLCATATFSQSPQKSHENCIKLVPGNWGPNFGVEWHAHESIYWGCRLGLPAETIKDWQRAAGLSGMTENILPVKIANDDLVLIEEMQGSMHCYIISALRKTPKGWEQVWTESGDDFCTMTCPPIRITIRGPRLFLDAPLSSNPDCNGHIYKRKYLWNGKTFAPVQDEPSAAQFMPPRFEDYPSAHLFTGTPASPILRTKFQQMFRTRIQLGMKKGPNFAGRYRIIQWGCGSDCLNFAVADLTTGKVYEPPFPSLWLHDFTRHDESSIRKGLQYKPDSTLMVVDGCPDDHCGTYYYQWSNESFKRIRSILK